jgi:hypothetical protein
LGEPYYFRKGLFLIIIIIAILSFYDVTGMAMLSIGEGVSQQTLLNFQYPFTYYPRALRGPKSGISYRLLIFLSTPIKLHKPVT